MIRIRRVRWQFKMALVVEAERDVDEDGDEVVVEGEVLTWLMKKNLERNLPNSRNRLSDLDGLYQRRRRIAGLTSKMPRRSQELMSRNLYLIHRMDMAGMKVKLVARIMLLRMRSDLFHEELGKQSLIL
jgi:hypothetical protein